MEAKSILEMAKGAIIERVDYEVPKIINNILDVNTLASKKRSLTITLDFIPDAERKTIGIKCQVKPPKLEPTNPVATTLYVTSGEMGETAVVELTPQVPGQVNMGGGEQEEPVLLKLVSGGN